jgi:hypothetical protein
MSDFDDIDEAAERVIEDSAPHPLKLFRPPPGEVMPEPGYLLPGVLCDGVSFVGAYAGAGKTTAVAPLLLIVAGLVEVPGLSIYGWRRVVCISEHPEQVEMIITALIRHHGIDAALVWERIKIVAAVRMTAAAVAEVSPDYRELTVTHSQDGAQADFLPWVVVDTQSALFEAENENDNAEMGRIVAVLKQDLALPVTVIAHTAKIWKHGDVQSMSIRGGGALEGDANQILYVSIDPDTQQRFIEVSAPKHRFVAKWDALALSYHVDEMPMLDPFGRTTICPVGFCTVEPVQNVERHERREEAAQERKREAVKDAREAVLARVTACEKLVEDNPDDPDYYPTKRTLGLSLDHPRAHIRTAVDELLTEKRIEVRKRPKGVGSGPRDYLAPVQLRRNAAAQSVEKAA